MQFAKHAELQRALADAAPDIVAPPLTLTAAVPTPMSAEQIADTHLNIVRHKDSGCIQFVFPVQHMQLMAGTAAGPGNWIVQAALRVKERMTQQMIETIEAHNKPEALLSLRHGWRQPATAAELAASRGRKVLLFVHGVFSSIEGAFSGLDADGTMRQLLARYDGQVYGYDHWTIAKTPQQNALDLLSHLPADAGWDVDIVCHSRGGLTVRSLLSAAPHAEDDVLAAIAAQRAGRIANVGKVFFVAAANQGSPLASPEDIRHFLNTTAMLASFSGGMALDLVIGLARMMVSLGFSRPSVQALATGSALIGQLNRSDTLLTGASIYYARADFDFGKSALERTGALINRMLLETDNDVVVPYTSVLLPEAQPADERMLSFGTPQQKQSEVWHTEFFQQPQMRDFLKRAVSP
ncbi:hypothetical protein Jab_2c11410 [Janthinobacterium sp. HH01]|uniref:esterase/lipase family protein n=1 Tax=Janthinobacterium sp. HH01 TaxID=1198452 RepID=UPI0002AEAA41|nr:hypothetical protein [Janthinobacterium sp. HH01]ELX09081.1 hypothetical protein Jab_2c11410 [Janthinobacterium sp. HH01]